MKVRAIGDDGTLSNEYDALPTSVIGFKFRGSRAGDRVGWMGMSYVVSEDNFGKRHEGGAS